LRGRVLGLFAFWIEAKVTEVRPLAATMDGGD